MDSKVLEDLIVFTKEGASFGISYLEKLQKENKKPKMIFVEKISWARKFKMFKFLKRKIGFFDALKYNINFWKNDILNTTTIDYTKYCTIVTYVDNINDNEVISKLNEYLESGTVDNIRVVLAHASLIKSELLENKNIFILNAHPAKLPEIRGVDVVRWSLYKRVVLGATIHFVNKGVDTGNIIEFQSFEVTNESDINSLSININNLSVDLLIKYTEMDLKNIECISQKDQFAFQHYLMPINLKKQLEQNIEKIIKEYKNGRIF